MQCDNCMMYDPYDNYCRWFQMEVTDFDYVCTIELPTKKSRKNEEE